MIVPGNQKSWQV